MLAGGAWLAGVIAIAAAIAAWEFFRIAEGAGYRPFSSLGTALAGLTPLAVYATYLQLWQPSFGSLAVLALVVVAGTIWRRGPDGHPMASAAVTILGVLYTGGMLSFGFAIRYHEYAFLDTPLPWSIGGWTPVVPAGGLLVLLPMFATWATDIGAYSFGRRYGRRKLLAAVSPGKTIAGAVGGLLVTMLIVWVYARFVLQPASQLGFKWPPIGLLILGAALSIAAQVGDLAESLFKREAGVKNSSNIIPGHGGVLDRFDSLLFVLPVAYWLFGQLLAWAPPS